MTSRRAQALVPALMLLAVPLAPPATADTAADCALLTQASGEYSKLAGSLVGLHKTAEAQQEDAAALTATQRKVVELARTIGDKLHDLHVQLKNPVLTYAFKADAESFYEYANTLEGAINNGDISGGNIHVTTSYTRNVDAVGAANDAYHAQCNK
ncbi:MAG: hypothetical protein ACRC20_05935 [Segniliparus sp.]|uniref:hypothetical protein n=1 Tax=Segniliparus sp. TaxID=2804064 RepID=UPI003F2A4A84